MKRESNEKIDREAESKEAKNRYKIDYVKDKSNEKQMENMKIKNKRN